MRQIEVDARGWDLGTRASTAAYDIARDAVSGWAASAADARAVRFSSLADLIACLSRDVAQGRASRLWFWHTWLRKQRVPSIGELWSDQIFEVPQLVRLIAARGVLAGVLAALTVPQVSVLMARIRQVTRWPLPPVMTAETAFEPEQARDPLSIDAEKTIGWLSQADILPDEKALAVPVAQLLAIVALWQHSPGVLIAEASAERAIKQVVRGLLTETSVSDGGAMEAGAAIEAGAETVNIIVPFERAEARRPADDVTKARHVRSEAGPATVSESGKTVESSVPATQPNEQPYAGDVRTPDLEHGQPDGFVTRQGGLFYLINALNRADIAERMEAPQSNGWLWLWHLGRALAFEPDAALLLFLADRLDCWPSEAVYDLAPPDGFEPVRAMLERQYGPTGVWTEELLQTPALVSLTASHLDIHMRLEDARPDVRKTGLDRDPGWVAWLGRVVAFRFGAAAELIGISDNE